MILTNNGFTSNQLQVLVFAGNVIIIIVVFAVNKIIVYSSMKETLETFALALGN